ncbi:hypothetical protein, partial [Stomatobaculum longum]|uniref:hypothetical protein n=1 Tax=Stomatobaculum longum TaxID=796942 RepID=UPI0028D631F0
QEKVFAFSIVYLTGCTPFSEIFEPFCYSLSSQLSFGELRRAASCLQACLTQHLLHLGKRQF